MSQTPSVIVLSQSDKVATPLVVTAGSALAYEVENTSSSSSVLVDGGGGFVRIGPGQVAIVENGGGAVANLSFALPVASYTWFSQHISNVSQIPAGDSGVAVRIKHAPR